ncbi:hypothetical protein DOE76_10625 [Leifsonia sp. ku-ls]|nr:hypothetical protein DOE76_10625 [Leifsonia sp. ku-ls]
MGSGSPDGGHGETGPTLAYGGHAGGGGGYIGGSGGVDYGYGCQSMGGAGGGSSYVRDDATEVTFGTASAPTVRISFVLGTPALSVRTVLSGSADNDGSGTHTLGDDLEFTSTATNTGDVTLSTVVVTDALTGRSRPACSRSHTASSRRTSTPER